MVAVAIYHEVVFVLMMSWDGGLQIEVLEFYVRMLFSGNLKCGLAAVDSGCCPAAFFEEAAERAGAAAEFDTFPGFELELVEQVRPHDEVCIGRFFVVPLFSSFGENLPESILEELYL